MLKRVPTVKTSYTQLELTKAFIVAWRELYNATPTEASVGVIISQIGIETGGTSFCWCNNLGNLKARDIPGQTVEYCVLNGTWEIINGKRIVLLPTDPGSWFRAFPTLEEGVKHHLNLLRNTRYKAAWSAVEQGSVVNFATLLRERGYYTASLASYIAGMNRFFGPYVKSEAYEHALIELDNQAPPLQPWVEITIDPPITADLQINSEYDKTPIEQGIEEAKQVPQEDIEKKGEDLASKLAGYLGNLLQWLQQRK